jgi:hypothetical protein
MSTMSDGQPAPGDRPPASTVRASDAGRAAARAEDRTSRDAPVGSPGAGLAYGGLAAGALTLVLFVAATAFAFSASLIVIALFGGRIVGLSVLTGMRGPRPQTTRSAIAILFTLVALTVALVATWAAARLTGGVLDLPTYLFDTLGAVVPLSYLLGALGAWWGAG